MRQQEVKWSEELHYEGRTIEQHYNIYQSDKAQLRALRKGVGTATLKMRPIGDRIVIHFNKNLKVELSLPQTPRSVQINNDNMLLLTEAQKRKKHCELLTLAGDGGYSAPSLPHVTGQSTPVFERPPPPPVLERPLPVHQQPQASDACLDAVVRAALAATPGADKAQREQKESASPDVAIVAERSTIVLRQPEALSSHSRVLEVVGDVITADEAESPVKKKKDNEWSPKTRASKIKKCQVKLTKKKVSAAEQKYLQEVKRHEEYREEYRKQVREFNKVQEKVEQSKGEKSKEVKADADEIPQLRIRDISTVRQEDPRSFEEICEGDILHLKEEPELVVDE